MLQEMPARELHPYLEQTNSDPLLLDVREPWEFDICHIQGSTLLPMRQVQQAMMELDKQRETVVICHHGIRSRVIARMLESAGFSRIINLSDGVDGWAKDVDHNMPTY
jgi:rhodanese-related sulfurtransferase